ncbi:MAG TPA: bifunctional diaminohydroxyphosphoribosylaminopyrimidine deaminase/5-amino-6-(5-phosphoribosylamino)uracil reductase RibD [Candidatus Cybelea sp.]
MEYSDGQLTPLDEVYLQRAYELAARGIGSTSPNPPVGAVIVRENRIVGEGYHHRAGEAHAETLALKRAGGAARGATLYVSLEPCGHVGATPPCAGALIGAGIVRVVAGALDPARHGGSGDLRRQGVDVVVANDDAARALVEVFERAASLARPYLTVKMAMSLDGAIAARPGVAEWLSGEQSREFVRSLRIAYDAVMVGAGTVAVDDPQLTVRPPRDRLRPYVRVVVCEREGVSSRSRIFAREAGYARTIVLAPGGVAETLNELRDVAEVVAVGAPDSRRLDLAQALEALRAKGIFSVVCEGGPTLAGRLIAARQADRFYWLIAPLLLRGETSVPVLAGAELRGRRLRFDRTERIGDDLLVSGVFADV